MYQLQILTPEAIFFDEPVVALIAPAHDGYLGVLTDHAPLIALIKPGFFILTDQNRQKHFYKVSAGFLEVVKNRATLLIDSIEPTGFVDMGSSSI